MSQTELNTGKLIPINMTEEEAREECIRRGVDPDYYGDGPFVGLAWETDDFALVEPLGFCRLEDFKRTDPDYYTKVTKNPDGSFDFFVIYYNGGANWPEVVEQGLKAMGD